MVLPGIIARRLGIPFVVTARGTDVNVIAEFDQPRRLILETARQAAAVIAVSEALRARMIEIGIAPELVREALHVWDESTPRMAASLRYARVERIRR